MGIPPRFTPTSLNAIPPYDQALGQAGMQWECTPTTMCKGDATMQRQPNLPQPRGYGQSYGGRDVGGMNAMGIITIHTISVCP